MEGAERDCLSRAGNGRSRKVLFEYSRKWKEQKLKGLFVVVFQTIFDLNTF